MKSYISCLASVEKYMFSSTIKTRFIFLDLILRPQTFKVDLGISKTYNNLLGKISISMKVGGNNYLKRKRPEHNTVKWTTRTLILMQCEWETKCLFLEKDSVRKEWNLNKISEMIINCGTRSLSILKCINLLNCNLSLNCLNCTLCYKHSKVIILYYT